MKPSSILLMFSAALLAGATCASQANANITITFGPSPTFPGGVRAVGSGSGVVSGSDFDDDWDYVDLAIGNILNVDVGDSHNTEFVAGSIANNTTNTLAGLQSTFLDSDMEAGSPSGDDFEFDTLVEIGFSEGDEFGFFMVADWPATAISVPAGPEADALLPSQLIAGTHVFAGGGGAGDENIFGDVTIIVPAVFVPEPSSTAMAIASMLGLAGLRRSRSS